MHRNDGLSLVELLIVVALILTFAAIAVPNLLRARVSANESAAVGSVLALNRAETAYASKYPNLGFTCDLGKLGPARGTPTADAAGLLDRAIATGEKSGYKFTLSNCGGTPAKTYSVVANPLPNEGVRKFCSDQSGIIRSDPGAGDCTAFSDPLQ